MNELSAFIREQLDEEAAKLSEDERVATAASADGPGWRIGTEENAIYPSDEARHPGPIIVGTYGYLDDDVAGHVARWDPARVLAEVQQGRRDIEAKKLILAWCDRMDPGDGLGGLMAPDARELRRLIAVKYADQPGYRAEWVPQKRPESDLTFGR